MDDRRIAHGYYKNDDVLSNSDRPQLLSNTEIQNHLILREIICPSTESFTFQLGSNLLNFKKIQIKIIANIGYSCINRKGSWKRYEDIKSWKRHVKFLSFCNYLLKSYKLMMM